MKNIIFILLSVICLSLFLAFFGDNATFLGFDDTQQKKVSLLSGAGYAVFMVFGIFAGQAHKVLGDPNVTIGHDFVKAMLHSNELWKSLLAAPVVFGAVYTMMSETNDVVLAAIFSFQNGFFCNSVLESKKPTNDKA